MAKQKAVIAPVFLRIKAFIVDMFFIAMPLFYITTYLVLGSKEAFQSNQIAIALIWLAYGAICAVFYAKSAQSPGYKFSNIYLIDLRSGRKVSFFRAFLRFLCFILACFYTFCSSVNVTEGTLKAANTGIISSPLTK